MTQSDRLTFGPGSGRADRRGTSGLLAPFMWLGGLVATVVAMAVGAVLAVITAAAVAVIAVVAAVLVFFAGLAMRARRRVTPRARRSDDVIEARKVDGAWVAYGWEKPVR
jgi:Flp pilus assembly protein TadB